MIHDEISSVTLSVQARVGYDMSLAELASALGRLYLVS